MHARVADASLRFSFVFGGKNLFPVENLGNFQDVYSGFNSQYVLITQFKKMYHCN